MYIALHKQQIAVLFMAEKNGSKRTIYGKYGQTSESQQQTTRSSTHDEESDNSPLSAMWAVCLALSLAPKLNEIAEEDEATANNTARQTTLANEKTSRIARHGKLKVYAKEWIGPANRESEKTSHGTVWDFLRPSNVHLDVPIEQQQQ